jgi:hypothetical protein
MFSRTLEGARTKKDDKVGLDARDGRVPKEEGMGLSKKKWNEVVEE